MNYDDNLELTKPMLLAVLEWPPSIFDLRVRATNFPKGYRNSNGDKVWLWKNVKAWLDKYQPRGITGVGDRMCDDCTIYSRCRDNLLACKEFTLHTAKYLGNPTLEPTEVVATHKIWQRLFYGEENRGDMI
jgi:hypothetical protein